MKTLIAILLLTSSASAQLSITKAQVDSLKLPFTLAELTSYLEKIINFDKPLLLERKWRVISTYYSFKATQKEIELLEEIRNNIKAIFSLNLKRKQQASIEDIEFLKSRNELIARELSLLKAQEMCRTSLLTMLQLCNVEIVSETEKERFAKDTQ